VSDNFLIYKFHLDGCVITVLFRLG